MALTIPNSALPFDNVIANNPISVAIQVYDVAHVFVYFGDSRLLATNGEDYAVELSDDFLSITVTCTPVLITKINTLISTVAGERNTLLVKRVLPGTNDFVETDAFVRRKIVNEIDMVLMRIQQLGFTTAQIDGIGQALADAVAASSIAVLAADEASGARDEAVAAAGDLGMFPLVPIAATPYVPLLTDNRKTMYSNVANSVVNLQEPSVYGAGQRMSFIAIVSDMTINAPGAAVIKYRGQDVHVIVLRADAFQSVTFVTDGVRWGVESTQNVPSQRCVGSNRTPNSNVQLNSRVSGFNIAASTLTKEDGSGFVPAIAVTLFDVSTGDPRMFTANTQGLLPGQLIHFGNGHDGLSGFPGANAGQIWSNRIAGVLNNVLFSLDHLPFGTQSPASSSAITGYPVGIFQGDGGYVADGHAKDNQLHYWPDDWPSNRCSGAKRVIGLRKNANVPLDYYIPVDDQDLPLYRGRNIVFGIRVYHKTHIGGGTSVAFIRDGVSEVTSVAATGITYNDPVYGKYELLTVRMRPSMLGTKLEYGIRCLGLIGDVCYAATPTLKYGDIMLHEDLGQEPGERIKCRTHHNPFFSIPFAGVTPNVDLGGGSFGWRNLDIAALGFGQCDNSVRYVNCKLEFSSLDGGSGGGLTILVCNADYDGNLTFGPQAYVSSVAATQTPMTWLPLGKGTNGRVGTFVIVFNHHDYRFQCTFDFDDAMA